MSILTEQSQVHTRGFCCGCGQHIEYDRSLPFCEKCKAGMIHRYCHSCGKEVSVTKFEPMCILCKPEDLNNNVADISYYKKYEYVNILQKFHIEVLWKYGLSDKIIMYDVAVLFQFDNMKEFNVNDILRNEVRHNRRVISIVIGWKNGLYFDIPEIKENNYIVQQGRHCILAAKFLGETKIPVKVKHAD